MTPTEQGMSTKYTPTVIGITKTELVADTAAVVEQLLTDPTPVPAANTLTRAILPATGLMTIGNPLCKVTALVPTPVINTLFLIGK